MFNFSEEMSKLRGLGADDKMTYEEEKMERMEMVWFFFKLFEVLMGAICMGIHIKGFLLEEPLPHKLLFCGPYFGFTAIMIFSIIGTSLGLRVSLFMETLISSLASFFYILASILSMYYAEQDFKLPYLSDYGEANHPFFRVSKRQSIASLYTGCLFMLHLVYSLDARIIVKETEDFKAPKGEAPISSVDYHCYQPIDMYIFGENIHKRLMQSNKFKRLIGHHVVHRFVSSTQRVRTMRENVIF